MSANPFEEPVKELSSITDYEAFKPDDDFGAMPGVIQNTSWDRANDLRRANHLRASETAHRDKPEPKTPEQIRAEHEEAHRDYLRNEYNPTPEQIEHIEMAIAEREGVPFDRQFWHREVLVRHDDIMARVEERDKRLAEVDAARARGENVSYFPGFKRKQQTGEE